MHLDSGSASWHGVAAANDSSMVVLRRLLSYCSAWLAFDFVEGGGCGVVWWFAVSFWGGWDSGDGSGSGVDDGGACGCSEVVIALLVSDSTYNG